MGSFSTAGVRIRAIASSVPSGCVRNEARPNDRVASRSLKALGIHERRIATRETAGDLCFAAARDLFAALEVHPRQVGSLFFVSQQPDHFLPATACILQQRLGLSDEVAAMDIGLGCSGYVYGLQQAALWVQATQAPALLLVGDTISQLVDKHDPATCHLFGDAGTATLLVPDGGAASMHFAFGSDGSGAKNLRVAAGAARGRVERLHSAENTEITSSEGGATPDPTGASVRSADLPQLAMNGPEVLAFSLQRVPELVDSLTKLSSCSLADFDQVVFHQANAFMLERLRLKLGIDKHKYLQAMGRYGNTSGASIPLALTHSACLDQRAFPGQTLMAGFGVGWSWAGAVVNLSGAQFFHRDNADLSTAQVANASKDIAT